MPAWPVIETSAGALLARGRVEQVLEQAQLRVAADERRLEAVRSGRGRSRSVTTRSARQAATGSSLPLRTVLAGRLEGDRAGRGALGRLADEDRAGRRDRLEPRRRVDQVAGDHALVERAEGHGRLAGQDARAGLDLRPEAAARRRRARAPARTARSASSSWATGAPQTAMTASPMNFSTVPP